MVLSDVWKKIKNFVIGFLGGLVLTIIYVLFDSSGDRQLRANIKRLRDNNDTLRRDNKQLGELSNELNKQLGILRINHGDLVNQFQDLDREYKLKSAEHIERIREAERNIEFARTNAGEIQSSYIELQRISTEYKSIIERLRKYIIEHK